MKKITKEDSTRKAKLIQQLKASKDKLDEAIKAYNALIDPAFTPVAAAVEEFNSIVEEVNGFRNDIGNDIQSYMDDRSEAWHEGDNASAYENWQSDWSSDLDEISIDEPDQLEIPDAIDESISEFEDLEEEVQL